MVNDTAVKNLPVFSGVIPPDAIFTFVHNDSHKRLTFAEFKALIIAGIESGGIQSIDDLVGVLPEAVTGAAYTAGQFSFAGGFYAAGACHIDNILTVGGILVLDSMSVATGITCDNLEAVNYVIAIDHVTANTLRFLNPITELQAADLPNGSLFANSDDANTLHFKTGEALFKVTVTPVA
jgi:hypothetical protein